MSSTKNSLLTHTSLSHDMINTIDKYVWQSLQSLAKNVKYKSYKLKKDITLRDILILCMNMGKSGFWLVSLDQNLIEKFENMIITENLTNDIIVYNNGSETEFYVKYYSHNINTFPLTRLDIFIEN
jgi:hypothetical protein